MTEPYQQRSRVYAAESLVERIYDRAARSGVSTVELHGSKITLPVERRFASIESMQRYAGAVLQLGWVRTAWSERSRVPVFVRARAGEAKAHYDRATATIAIPPHRRNQAWAMREFVLLHELAHHLEPDQAEAAHGPAFADRLVVLVSEIIGPEAGLLLRVTMHENGVRLGLGNGMRL